MIEFLGLFYHIPNLKTSKLSTKLMYIVKAKVDFQGIREDLKGVEKASKGVNKSSKESMKGNKKT